MCPKGTAGNASYLLRGLNPLLNYSLCQAVPADISDTFSCESLLVCKMRRAITAAISM
jgi:hypothetical protein